MNCPHWRGVRIRDRVYINFGFYELSVIERCLCYRGRDCTEYWSLSDQVNCPQWRGVCITQVAALCPGFM